MHYHGSHHQFIFRRDHLSRYGFPVIFLSGLHLATLYADYHYRESGIRGKVFVTELDTTGALEIDWGGRSSYSAAFRNLIFAHKKKGTKILIVKNVVDAPSPGHQGILSTITVVFALKKITGFAPMP